MGGTRTPGFKLMLAIGIGFLLSIPLFSIYLLNYGRQSESSDAMQSITSGWGGQQVIGGPVLVIPYRTSATTTSVESGQSVTRTSTVERELQLAPEILDMTTGLQPQLRKRSIYQAVIYDATMSGRARFAFPPDLGQTGVDPAQMDLTRAELRFSVSDARGLGSNPKVVANGVALRLQPGGGSAGGRGFLAPTDATGLASKPLTVGFEYGIRGNETLSLAPLSGDTRWTVHSPWPSPSFGGDFLPGDRQVSDKGFDATYRIGNLALGRSLADTIDPNARQSDQNDAQVAQISLIQPVDIYSQVNRATKYGFLFIGFTFLALLMFDVIGGVRVSSVEYLLMGAALVLFFVLLLAFAEVIGFAPAYVLAAAAIAGLNTAYAAAVLASWRRAAFIGALLIGLYAVLYVLISLEAFALLIGSLLLFAALAGVMYATRRIDWGARSE
ncbi:MAG: cell envelope integrity protein CreD, partial [Sphingomonas sp.]|nr:cell envelope integrity protein CreD [Sphingomonas sp.]